MVLNTEDGNAPCAMKVLSKRKLNKIFMGKNRTAMNDVMQEIAIMKKLVSSIKFIFNYRNTKMLLSYLKY